MLWFDGRRAVAALDCNANGAFDDEDDRRIIFEDSGNVQLAEGDGDMLVEDAAWGEQVGPDIEWQMPLVELPANCRGSSTPVAMRLFIDRTMDNSIISEATGSHTLNNPMDFGDARNLYYSNTKTCDDYPTLLECQGPRHGITPLHLGVNVDADNGDLQNDAALADDESNMADEDGVAPQPGYTWNTGNAGGKLDVIVSNGYGYLSCWIDWNDDGDFDDSGERVMDDFVVGEGQQTEPLTVPTGVNFDKAYMARCRISAAENISDTPTGAVMSGEVEDYLWLIQPVDAQTSASSGDININWTSLDQQNDEEQAYKSATPYFQREDATSLGWSGNSGTATDPNVVGGTPDVSFYKVIGSALIGGSETIYSTPSQETGLFEFSLTPGGN